MIELPETYVLSNQIEKTIVGKTIRTATANAHPHGFAWYTGDPAAYSSMLEGKKVTGTNPGTGYTCGGNTEILCEDMMLVINTPIKYHEPGKKLPKSHQLHLEFEDDSHITCTVQMYGGMFCFPTTDKEQLRNFGDTKAPNPFSDEFNEAYFDTLWGGVKPTLSVKAFLATEQRIPGLGNGVLQDILFNANIHPKRKLESIDDNGKEKLFHSVKSTLTEMKDSGGRDTEKDLFNQSGGYKTILSKITLPHPCRVCGSGLVRQAFLGGNIYFCGVCQPL